MAVNINFYTKQFEKIKGYNKMLMPHNIGTAYMEMFHTTLLTMQFYYYAPYNATLHVDTFERHHVIIRLTTTILHLYMDEDAYLFPHKISKISVGKLNTKNGLWDGTANVDIEYIKHEHPFIAWNV